MVPYILIKKVPCNDGGLSLGQLWIAHQKIYKRIIGYIRVLSFMIQLN